MSYFFFINVLINQGYKIRLCQTKDYNIGIRRFPANSFKKYEKRPVASESRKCVRVTCFRLNMSEKCVIWRKTTITHSISKIWCYRLHIIHWRVENHTISYKSYIPAYTQALHLSLQLWIHLNTTLKPHSQVYIKTLLCNL